MVSTHTKLLAGVCALAAGISAHAAGKDAAGPDTARRRPDIEKIVADISPQRIEATIRKLVGFHTRHTMSETESDTVGIGAARRWIKSEFERCNMANGGRLQVAFDSVRACRAAKGADAHGAAGT